MNEEGFGPSWANSLFEDNAEYGYGMALADRTLKEKIELLMKKAIVEGISGELKKPLKIGLITV